MKKHTLANKTTPKWLEHKMCLTICIVTKPHLDKVCIFLPILFKGKLIHYICVIPILLCCYHTFHRPWTQIWIQAFIVVYQNLTFKSVKQNCCFRNQRWDAVKSHQALKKGCIKSTNQNAIFFAWIYQTPIWIDTKINLFLIGINIYKPVDMPHKWTGSTPK